MGRLTKAKIDEIIKLRQEDYTQKETAEKAKVHIRTVRKYDPLREKPVKPSREQAKELEETCDELVAEGLLHEESNGRLRISSLGRRVYVKLEEIEKKAVLQFMAEADRPVTAVKIAAYLDEIGDELLDQALDEVRRHQKSFGP
jgi:DNA-binding transcriptional MerR regulator